MSKHDAALVEAVARGLYEDDGFTWEPKSPLSRNLYLNRATAALDAIEAAGCVVVPREPTAEMTDAAWDASLGFPGPMNSDFPRINADIYRAMLAARPGGTP